MMNHASKLALVSSLLIMAGAGCARSPGYRAEQEYYKSDSEYANRKGGLTSRASRFGQPKKRIYVLPFMNATPLGGQEFGEFAAEELMREIRASGRAVVPGNLRISESSGDFYAGNKVRVGTLSREGRKLGLSLIVIGKIKKIVYRTKGDDIGLFRSKKSIAAVDLEMRIFDVINQKEVLLDEKSADNSSNQVDLLGDSDSDPKSQRAELVRMALRSGMTMFARDTVHAIEKLTWEGRIAKITGGHIYINAGRATGLNLGDVLKVLTGSEDVYDPDTGAYLGRSRGQPKGTLEVVDYLGTDGAVAVVHSGGNFAENDVVQLY